MSRIYTITIFFLALLTSCTGIESNKTKGQLVSKQPELSFEQVRALSDLAQHLYRKYSPNDYIYLYIGQSPSPIYALLQSIESKLPVQPVQLALPISRGIEIPGLIVPVQEETTKPSEWYGGIDYLKKLFDHYDVYLEAELLREIYNTGANKIKKILLIDYVVSGHSLGAIKQSIDYYLRYKSQNHPAFLNLSSEYFAISHEPAPFSILKDNIDSYQIPYPNNYPDKINLNQISQTSGDLSVSSKYLAQIDMRQRIKAINRNTAYDRWYWKGEVFDLNQLESGSQIISSFLSQSFDVYSPYGSWELSLDELGMRKESSQKFKDLVEFFKICHGRG